MTANQLRVCKSLKIEMEGVVSESHLRTQKFKAWDLFYQVWELQQHLAQV